ncbi:MAG: enoyl-CoA hydratase/isomerase family protein [Deltaproteobacteria bacterium]|nr:enoyl-CoA hydratase/isomerase family protein [Deltaproteobacteria bacterium]
MHTIKTSRNDDGVFTVELARPEVRNAFNEDMIADLQKTFDRIAKDEDIRVVILRSSGDVFCAGGDLNWMKKGIALSAAENLNDTRRLTRMFETMNNCPKPVVGFARGAAIGGGVGLVSVCDYVVCEKNTAFSLSEVRLGIIPACIGPFVIAKIGETHARALFISAERFTATRAYEIGLVHELADSATALEAAQNRIVANLLQCGPNAMAAAKALIRGMKNPDRPAVLDYVAKMLADLRVMPEGQEGIGAFLGKRKPSWIKG